jgi:hypothetical protein
MPQTEVHPIQGACQHMRGRYKLQPSHKSPFPEKRFVRYECERGHEIADQSDEDMEKCFAQQTGCWKEGDPNPAAEAEAAKAESEPAAESQ